MRAGRQSVCPVEHWITETCSLSVLLRAIAEAFKPYPVPYDLRARCLGGRKWTTSARSGSRSLWASRSQRRGLLIHPRSSAAPSVPMSWRMASGRSTWPPSTSSAPPTTPRSWCAGGFSPRRAGTGLKHSFAGLVVICSVVSCAQGPGSRAVACNPSDGLFQLRKRRRAA